MHIQGSHHPRCINNSQQAGVHGEELSCVAMNLGCQRFKSQWVEDEQTMSPPSRGSKNFSPLPTPPISETLTHLTSWPHPAADHS